MQIACINGSRISFQPDWFNDDIVCFGTLQNLQQWLERAKKQNKRLWSRKLSKPPQNVHQWSIKWFERDIPAMDEVEFRLNFQLSHVIQQGMFLLLQHASLGREGLGYNIENRACAAIVHSFRKPRTMFKCIYTNAFMSKVSHGLDKPSAQLLGQDKPRLELAMGWMSREGRFCTIYKYRVFAS